MISSVLIFLVLFVGYVWGQVQSFWQTRQLEMLWERQGQQPAPAHQVNVHEHAVYVFEMQASAA